MLTKSNIGANKLKIAKIGYDFGEICGNIKDNNI